MGITAEEAASFALLLTSSCPPALLKTYFSPQEATSFQELTRFQKLIHSQKQTGVHAKLYKIICGKEEGALIRAGTFIWINTVYNCVITDMTDLKLFFPFF